MNKDEIKKALGCCSLGFSHCKDCPYNNNGYFNCGNGKMYKDALNLITEQEKEIKRLETFNDKFCQGIYYGEHLYNRLQQEKKQAVKEFAEKLKEKLFSVFGKTLCSDFDTEDITIFIDELLMEYEKCGAEEKE